MAEPIWVVDAGLATQYGDVVRAMTEAGAVVRVFDFPGAALASGKRYAWARDYGPLPTSRFSPVPWKVWDAVNGGSATPELDHQALKVLAQYLGAQYEAVDLTVQGGNWLPLADGRVITSTRFFTDNAGRGSRQELASSVRPLGVREIIEIAPMPGELTQHADMVVAVHPTSSMVFVAELRQEAIDLIPADPGWDMYRDMAKAIRERLDRTHVELAKRLGGDAVARMPQPLPYLDRHPQEDRYRPTFPSFVNGIFVTDAAGRTTYLYALSGDPEGTHFYSFDVALLERYREEMDEIGRSHGFATRGIQTGDLIRNGGSLHCATTECYRFPADSPE